MSANNLPACPVPDRRRAGLGGPSLQPALHHGHVGVGLRGAQDRRQPARLLRLGQPRRRPHHPELRPPQEHQRPQGKAFLVFQTFELLASTLANNLYLSIDLLLRCLILARYTRPCYCLRSRNPYIYVKFIGARHLFIYYI